MAIKIQYNKTALQVLKKQLEIRHNALPILKNKETALRLAAKKIAKQTADMQEQLSQQKEKLNIHAKFWTEFPNVIQLGNIRFQAKNVVGVSIPDIQEIEFKIKDFSWFAENAWVPQGLDAIKLLLTTSCKIALAQYQLEILNQSRKKTTQKVNLYEKVQIPAYESAIVKIKRFLQDKENIAKAAQKIINERNRRKEAEL